MIYGPYSPIFFERVNTRDNSLNALEAVLSGVEAVWITSQGSKVFRQDLSGVVDDERRTSRYLKVRK